MERIKISYKKDNKIQVNENPLKMSLFCRLCAEAKEPNQMITNLSSEDIHTKLYYCCNYWTYYETFDLQYKEICSNCVDSLEKCWTFLRNVEAAQNKLREFQVNLSSNNYETNIVINDLMGSSLDNDKSEMNPIMKCETIFMQEKGESFVESSTAAIGEPNYTSKTDERTFECYLCPKSYTLFPSLKDHMVLHTFEKHIKCKYCKARFRTMRQYKCHERSHIDHYVCEVCKKKFESAYMLEVCV